MTLSYVIITPVRNEERYLPKTIESVLAQSIRPSLWVIVNDGSTDATARLIDQASKDHPWIRAVHRPDRGFRKSGGGVIEAFYDGYHLVESESWDYLAKLDGDLSFAPNYFQRCFECFEQNPKLGIGGGSVWSEIQGHRVNDGSSDPKFHVRGATKIYRRSCWEAIGGIFRGTGWDTLDELKANMLGWQTCSFPELQTTQLKFTGSVDGAWKNWFKNGRANYITGYHPLFMITKCVKRIFTPPMLVGALGLFCGFMTGYLKRVPQVADPQLIHYLRQQQLNRLLFRESLWS